MTQTESILKYLSTGATLTPIDALNMFGCFRLSARIRDLKEDGYEITTLHMSHGEKTFACYKMKPREEFF